MTCKYGEEPMNCTKRAGCDSVCEVPWPSDEPLKIVEWIGPVPGLNRPHPEYITKEQLISLIREDKGVQEAIIQMFLREMDRNTEFRLSLRRA